MATRKVSHPTLEERREVGKAARKRMPRSNLEGWQPAPDRPDPVALLEDQDATREPDLVPVRHGRMMVSPFTFYRGGAKIMAADLATSLAPVSTSSCAATRTYRTSVSTPHPSAPCSSTSTTSTRRSRGPSNTTWPGCPSSFVVAARDNGFSDADAREHRHGYGRLVPRGHGRLRADGHALDVWYSRLGCGRGRVATGISGREEDQQKHRRKGREGPRRRQRRRTASRPSRS